MSSLLERLKGPFKMDALVDWLLISLFSSFPHVHRGGLCGAGPSPGRTRGLVTDVQTASIPKQITQQRRPPTCFVTSDTLGGPPPLSADLQS